MAAGLPHVKGLSLLFWWESFGRLEGAAAAEALLRELPPELVATIRAGFQVHAWYPIEWFRALCAGARLVTGEGLGLITRVARTSAASEFAGVHRVLVLFLSPQRLLRAASRVFERYYTEGQVTSTARGKNGAEVRWSGCLGFDQNLWHDSWAAAVVLIEMCGGRDVLMEHMFGGQDGDAHATVVFYWQ